MLFDHAEIPRKHVSENNITAPPTKRQRFKPLRTGKLALARIDLDLDDAGAPKFRQTKYVRSIGLKVVIASGQHEGRWFFDRLVLEGHEPSKRRMKATVRAILACHGIDDDIRVSRIHGLTVPIRIEQQPHWQTGKMENVLVALSPDPLHSTADDYYTIVSKLGEAVPGWNLYPDSRPYNLIMKRRAALLPDETGISLVEKRRLRSCHDRFYENLGLSRAAAQDAA